ncbi:hypothetical protein NDU88_005462 [Pleurodeles waltl]|uniref:Uncharacterized protein n=1 Tax=Pleurodeles waltl TaxID=8319 RepID=A0AAV7X0Q9_PLEWA|nr:hypothetical protein NDU88_005462 [Pleurodeles waltl]
MRPSPGEEGSGLGCIKRTRHAGRDYHCRSQPGSIDDADKSLAASGEWRAGTGNERLSGTSKRRPDENWWRRSVKQEGGISGTDDSEETSRTLGALPEESEAREAPSNNSSHAYGKAWPSQVHE